MGNKHERKARRVKVTAVIYAIRLGLQGVPLKGLGHVLANMTEQQWRTLEAAAGIPEHRALSTWSRKVVIRAVLKGIPGL